MTKARDNANNWAADITGVTAGTGITGGGTSGTVTVTNSLLTTIDAAGDLLYGTGSDAATRLGIGTAGQVLTVNSGATAPQWSTPSAGGYTLISTTTLSGTSVNLTSIPGTYRDLVLVLQAFQPPSQHYQSIQVGSASTADLGSYDLYSIDGISTTNVYTAASGRFYTTRPQAPGWHSSNNGSSQSVITIPNYTNTTCRHLIHSYTTYVDDNNARRVATAFSNTQQTGAITRINIATGLSGSFTGTALLYGVS